MEYHFVRFVVFHEWCSVAVPSLTSSRPATVEENDAWSWEPALEKGHHLAGRRQDSCSLWYVVV
jgi:hypothetical protein